ncbi:dihydrofolate reductase [Schaalia suimastitidis]|uniref:dihydrofolate reductase n=1 Tax=Schaalia suimastitidis TaxID=121163 RepID=UPI0005553FCE|nr:dihydrofolate reductase [Schaalia suimastitidis]
MDEATTGVRIASIWAQDRRGLLGSGTAMLWHVPADFAHFKASTLGCPVLMGRASWEALGRPLPGRLNVVLSRDTTYVASGAVVVSSLEDGIVVCRDWAREHTAHTVWIAGGGAVYAQALPLVDELVVTHLDLEVNVPEGAPAVYAPPIDSATWRVDEDRSDQEWRPISGDAAWKVVTYIRR